MALQYHKKVFCLALLIAFPFSQTPALAQSTNIKTTQTRTQTRISPNAQAILDHISTKSLRTNLTYLASDELEGRDTPSRGLDLAAHHIAAQFKAAGLEPVGDDGYFQTADWNLIAPRHQGEAAPPTNLPPVEVRNVIGLLRGSDSILKNTYVLVSAHYDHLGIKEGKIYNGANDDASGTASVIELAHAFASMKTRPKRSIVFMTFFGEEKGLVGSRYYGANPIFPVKQTVAGINLEQIGRTDDSEGAQINAAGVTGFDFSEVGSIIKTAGAATGINIWKHPVNSDKYFAFSDNQALADQGVPAHTLSVAYGFPDYHQAEDDSDKIDYDNMAKINRTIALAVEMIANNPQPPKWDAKNPKVTKYLNAWKANNLDR